MNYSDARAREARHLDLEVFTEKVGSYFNAGVLEAKYVRPISLRITVDIN